MARVIDGEAIIINLGNGLYYGTRGVGAVVWEGIAAGASIESIARTICQRFAVSPDVAEAGVVELVATLVDEQLVLPGELSAAPMPDPSPAIGPNTSYEPPKLEKYTDMAQFLALDPPLPSLDV